MSAELTPAMLTGTPVGGPGGHALCDTCNKGLTDGEREHDRDDKEAEPVFVYATCAPGTNRWALRWVSCEACGPPGMAEADMPDGMDEPEEVVATATLAYDERVDAFVLANPELPTDEETPAEGGESQ